MIKKNFWFVLKLFLENTLANDEDTTIISGQYSNRYFVPCGTEFEYGMKQSFLSDTLPWKFNLFKKKYFFNLFSIANFFLANEYSEFLFII